jgi:hypothetical protein
MTIQIIYTLEYGGLMFWHYYLDLYLLDVFFSLLYVGCFKLNSMIGKVPQKLLARILLIPLPVTLHLLLLSLTQGKIVRE